MLSAVILTKNEEQIIARCIQSVSFADEILILDSGSTDQTCEISRKLGAVVYHQEWLGWLKQHQTAVELARNDWIIVLDADEIITSGLRSSIINTFAKTPDPRDGFVLDRRDEFFSQLFPNTKRKSLRNSFVRIFNRKYSSYSAHDIIHERIVCPGRMIKLSGMLIHWRAYSVADQLSTYIRNSPLEADMMQQHGIQVGWTRLLIKPILRFLWCFVYCGGFKMGTAGVVHAMMFANAEFTRQAVLWERQSVVRQIDPPSTLWETYR